ncbi:MAG: PIN domain-containing protein [Alphaproteobacteria bacterium]
MVVYIDSSVALAELLGEDRAPRREFWQAAAVSSRLIEYEVWNRLQARRAAEARFAAAQSLLAGIQQFEMTRQVLARALEPWPVPLRTLDALHLATAEYLRRRGEPIELASYDNRLREGARALGIPLAAL